jgi:hypothetical protein
MEILLFLTGVLALAGAWLVVDFFLWFFTGHVTPARIDGFEKGMPVLSFEMQNGKQARVLASAITHIGYRLAKPQEGDIFNVIYREAGEGSEVIVRVHGFLYLIAGVLAFMPLLAVLAMKFSKGWMMSQLSFLTILIVIVLGGWIGLKAIRRNY